jgi:hypothetical protein
MTSRANGHRAPDRFTTASDVVRRHAAWLLPTTIAVLGIVPTVLALRAQTFAIFGRDQGIFQYVAWAIRNGDRVYRDLHEINGPLPHAWHVVMQSLGGEDEHVFRSIDTILLVTVYVFAATTLPRWIALELGRRFETNGRGPLVAWAVAGLTVLGAQYVRYDWWHTSQREAFYSVLVLASLSLQAIGQSTKSRRIALPLFFFAGITTSLTWFGKPPCVIFSILQACVLVLDRKSVMLPIRRAALAALTGALLVFGGMLAFVLVFEDLRLGIELLAKVPRLHHTIWNETLLGSYRAYNNAPKLDWALATFAAFIAVYFLLDLPRRALLAGVLPAGGFLVFAGQGKAFPYHLHMLTLGTGVMQLVILGAIARWLARAPAIDVRPRKIAVVALAVMVGAIALGTKAGEDAWKSPSLRHRWAAIGATPSLRASRGYVERFPWGDYFANDLRDGAAYLAFHTRPDERVQTYGFDPYLLFLARRKSASPIVYSFELNVDAALEGGPGARPSTELKTWLRTYRDDAERLVLHSVEAAPPAAFALLDQAPFSHPANAETDFAKHCPDLFAWMMHHYVFAAAFGTVRIWLRKDVYARGAAAAAL